MSVNQFNIQIMKKIKIDKIQISDMSPDEKMNVNGGDNAQNQQDAVWTVTVVTVTVTLFVPSSNSVSKRPLRNIYTGAIR